MNTFNDNLNIPDGVQTMLNRIDTTPLNLGELAIDPHPKFPMYDRFIRIVGLETSTLNEFAHVKYVQVLKSKDTKEELLIPLSTPEWCIYQDTWSYLRDNKTNTVIELPLKDGSGTDKVKISSYRYMVFLLRNGVSIIPILQGYLPSFVASKLEELNKL